MTIKNRKNKKKKTFIFIKIKIFEEFFKQLNCVKKLIAANESIQCMPEKIPCNNDLQRQTPQQQKKKRKKSPEYR